MFFPKVLAAAPEENVVEEGVQLETEEAAAPSPPVGGAALGGMVQPEAALPEAENPPPLGPAQQPPLGPAQQAALDPAQQPAFPPAALPIEDQIHQGQNEPLRDNKT